MYSKPNEPYIHINYRNEVYKFLKHVYKDVKIKDKDKNLIEIPITTVYPKNFTDLPCITYNQVNEVSSKNNLNDQFFPNPINDSNDIIFQYTPNEWNDKLVTENNKEKIPNTKVNEVISKYSSSEWNYMMSVYRETGVRLWEDTSEELPKEDTDEDTNTLDDNIEVDEIEEEKPKESVPSTPIEFPFKPYNPMIYTELEYQIDFWAKKLNDIVNLINRLDEYIVHGPARLTKTYTSSDLYEKDTQIYHKVIRFKALVDNHGNIFTGW